MDGRRDVHAQKYSCFFVAVSAARVALPLAVYSVRQKAAHARNGRERK